MPNLFIKALECVDTDENVVDDSIRLEISVDDKAPIKLTKHLDGGHRWILDRDIEFSQMVKIKLWELDTWPNPDDFLGTLEIGSDPTHRATGEIKSDNARYLFWYEVRSSTLSRQDFHRPQEISVREMLGRIGRGVLTRTQHRNLLNGTAIYRCSEVISIRGTFSHHAIQDGNKGKTNSLRTWVFNHCNPWGEESVIPLDNTPRAFGEVSEIYLENKPNWLHVKDEGSYSVGGFQHFSRHADTDYMARHVTMDWNWDFFVDPAYMYMLNYTASRVKLSRDIIFPILHNEWETNSMPIQWRPFWGEYVTIWGRHIFDVGHLPVKTEIHPPHTIIREHTSAAALGDNGTIVPVNRAIIGMGLSGGKPVHTGSRWNDETDGSIPDIVTPTFNGLTYWITNLKKHPLRFKLFPPVAKPSNSAKLQIRLVLCEMIQTSDWKKALELNISNWNRTEAVVTPEALKPRFTLHADGYYIVEVNLSQVDQIPVAYYAIVECGWSERGQHRIHQFDVSFEKVKAVKITDIQKDDWKLFYGVNGQWSSWLTSNDVKEGESYTRNTKFHIFTVDDMPLLFRDCGIDKDPTVDVLEGEFLAESDVLDRLEINSSGPNHLASIRNHTGIQVLNQTTNSLQFTARAWEMSPQFSSQSTATKHEWTISVVHQEL